jgi:hypothetical protein
MLAENPSSTANRKLLTSPLTYTSFLILAVAIYVGWVFFSRRREDRAYDQRVRNEQLQKQRESDQAAIAQLGGSELAIQMLYATPQIQRGETAQVCFGVANAKSVTLEPQSNAVWPSHNLCVDVKPAKTTTYTLTATGSDGHSVSQEVTVAVR